MFFSVCVCSKLIQVVFRVRDAPIWSISNTLPFGETKRTFRGIAGVRVRTPFPRRPTDALTRGQFGKMTALINRRDQTGAPSSRGTALFASVIVTRMGQDAKIAA